MMYFVRMIIAFSQVRYEEAYWEQVRLNEMYFSLFVDIHDKYEKSFDE